ncbi:hypothetical protein [Nonomuraea dietziae]|uniref:hypothetical protein n=1 Tax=Nonomuraea dietziae TaxID=65515 RepID=UPI0031D9512E
MTGRGRAGLPLVLAVAALAIALVTAALDARAAGVPIPEAAQLDPGWPAALSGLAMLVPGVLLLRMLPRHAVAWVLTGFGLLVLADGMASSWAGPTPSTSRLGRRVPRPPTGSTRVSVRRCCLPCRC